jgi:abortive infection bacteriophage resistance protein
LEKRGLIIPDKNKAAHYLANISYYRLRAYTYPFQNNDDSNHTFIKPVTFDQVLYLYVLDRELRLIVFDAIERIEIALRTQIIYHFALQHGSHWFENPNLYIDNTLLRKDLYSLEIRKRTQQVV